MRSARKKSCNIWGPVIHAVDAAIFPKLWNFVDDVVRQDFDVRDWANQEKIQAQALEDLREEEE